MKAIRATYRLYQHHVQYIEDLVSWGYAKNKSAAVRKALMQAWHKEAVKNGIYQQFERSE